MNDILQVETNYGLLKGVFSTSDMKYDFNGGLFREAEKSSLLSISFSFPFSFAEKFGLNWMLNEIKLEVEDALVSGRVSIKEIGE